MISAEISRICKHGFTVDLTAGDRRCHLRVFEFKTERITPEGEHCEMPAAIDRAHVAARLRLALAAFENDTPTQHTP